MGQRALEVFESREAATRWMSVPNRSLGHSIPLMLCSTGLGAV
ncbi:MbcA/ParS/Xre antitoxin family protein [Pseudomonas sp. Ant30-3]